jgi:hypothetical protein
MTRRYEQDEPEDWSRQQQSRQRRMDEEFRARNWSRGNEGPRFDWAYGGEWNRGMGGNWYQGRWEGNRMQGPYAGMGPRSFKRPDDRIEEDINEQLTRHPMIDATDIEVKVQDGEVTLHGHVDSREAKRTAEAVAESVFGVKDVSNQIKIRQRDRMAG